jgi:hypothetical protein
MRRRRRRPQIGVRLIVVGGQCSGVGKTALIVDILRAMPEKKWTAVKITPHGERGVPKRNRFSIQEEAQRRGRWDTSRFLRAGAVRALWVQTRAGRLKEALRALEKELKGSANVIIESDAIMRHWKADLFVVVLDPRMADFKKSARSVIGLADVLVYRWPVEESGRTDWPNIVTDRGRGKCSVLQPLGQPLPQKLQKMLSSRRSVLNIP